MVKEEPPEIYPLSGSVPGQELLLMPISGSRWRQNSGVNIEKESSLRVFGMRGINRRKIGHQGGPTWPGGQGARPAPGHARWPPGQGVAPPGPPSGFWSLPMNKNFCKFFYFSGDIDFSPFSAMHGQKQIETGTGH